MDRKNSERITAEYLKQIYGFTLKRCAITQDAEDLTQEICLKLFRALLVRDDVEDISKFVWTIAHNALANYYRGKQAGGIGFCIDEYAEILPSGDVEAEQIIRIETENKLHQEIARLSKLQRRIVISYYYENKKQDEIADELGIPLGTVKWHLFEAKKDLKKGMETVKTLNELKFDPIKFAICGISGSVGTKGRVGDFFRSVLSQNIAYCTLHDGKTINEIADALGVSPVYVESEAEYLEEYGFLRKQSGKYLCNILLDEPTTELNELESAMYEKAAYLFANELYEALADSDLLDGGGVIYDPIHGSEKDKNFIMWALIPYIAALSGEKQMDKTITFDEAATIRPDGGHNICYASVLAPDVKPPMYFDSMKKWCGPCWNSGENHTLWQIDSEWSAKRVGDGYQNTVRRDLTLFEHFFRDELLSADEYAYMAGKGYLKTSGDPKGHFTASLNIVWIKDAGTRDKLLMIGDKIKESHKAELDSLKMPLIKAVMANMPKHLHKMCAYGLQHIFYSDGWFILHCLKALLKNGKLKLPTDEQKLSLTTIIVPNK